MSGKSGWSSYTSGKWNVAGEWITRANDGWQQDKNITGYSLYTKYDMNAKYQLFARFDKIGSNILEGGTTPWHLTGDGTALVAGLQFTPVNRIRMALNYQDWNPGAASSKTSAYIYLNLEVKL